MTPQERLRAVQHALDCAAGERRDWPDTPEAQQIWALWRSWQLAQQANGVWMGTAKEMASRAS